jgi:nitroreductase
MIRPIKQVLKHIYFSKLQILILRACVRWKRLGSLYYVFNPAFHREHRAVLSGKLRHITGQDGGAEEGRYTLRRNTHRIEKGLIMIPRRPVFASSFIEETTTLYAESLRRSSAPKQPSSEYCAHPRRWGLDDPDVAINSWAGDVLHRYFEAVKPGLDARVDNARSTYQSAVLQAKPTVGNASPFARPQEALPITPEALEALAIRRRSVRWYQDKPVPRDLIDWAIRVAAEAPSACNRQPFEFRVFDDPALAKEIGRIPMGTDGFSQNFPCLIVVVGKLRAFPYERDRHLPYIDASLATMALLFALEVRGLASCCINWPDMEAREQAMSDAIGLSPDERVVMCISVGYPLHEGHVPYSQKQTLCELRRYNTLSDEKARQIRSAVEKPEDIQ